VNHKPDGRLPLLSARPALALCYQFCCSVNGGTIGVNSLPKTFTRQRCDCNLNPGPSAPESTTLTTRLPSHPSSRLGIFKYCDHGLLYTSDVKYRAPLIWSTCIGSCSYPAFVIIRRIAAVCPKRELTRIWRAFSVAAPHTWNSLPS